MLGNYLREQRLKAGLSIKDISRGTRIRSEYLKALEEEQYSKIPGEVYIKGYINEYLRVLGINPQKALELYEQDRQLLSPSEPVSTPPKRKFASKYYYLAITLLLVIPAVYLITPDKRELDTTMAENVVSTYEEPVEKE
ncbi:MAG: hypothetical protein GXO99_03585, partial [Nitrospirae bacterium]|nr:hypothetical protein [Nitrospirota bacterium]